MRSPLLEELVCKSFQSMCDSPYRLYTENKMRKTKRRTISMKDNNSRGTKNHHMITTDPN